MKLALAALFALTAACSKSAAEQAPAPPRTTADLLGSIAALAGASLDDAAITSWVSRIDRGEATLDSYLDDVLANPRFGRDILPALVFGAFATVRNYYAFPSSLVLKSSDPAAGPVVRYLREPCDAAAAARVKPWWALDTDVLVCPDAYRPDTWRITTDEQSFKSKMVLACDSQVGSPEQETKSVCGCGPNLIRCLRDMTMYDAMTRSAMQEVKDTTAYVAEHDLPITALFTSNESFRDRNMEYYYRRQKIGALQIGDVASVLDGLAAWPEHGTWAPREELRPGQHAGMLTTPQVLHWLPDRRQRQRGYYEVMWCANRSSFGATTEKIIEISDTANLAFVHDSWKRLAHTPVCSECHARLDYGFQFFMGYPDSRASTHFIPDLQRTGSGELFGNDIDDPRGANALTPKGFGELATAQPELAHCLAGKLTSYVLGEIATPADRDAIAKTLADTGRFKAVAKVALQRYAMHWKDPNVTAQAQAPASPAAGAAPRAGWIAVGPALRTELDAQCVDCHDEEPYQPGTFSARPFDLRGAELPRTLAIRMTDHVAHGQMPKPPNVLAPADRERMIRLLVAALFPDATARAEAERYFLGMMQALPAQLVDHTLHTVNQRANPTAPRGDPWGALERSLWPDQALVTPGFVAMTALEALRACRGTQSLDTCLARTITTANMARAHP